MEKIGFVGTGAMGSALLSRLKLANVVATAFDIAPQAMEAARAEGAETAPSAKAVAQNATIIDVVVRTDQEVLECMLGDKGVLEGAAPGSLVLLHSTIRPATTKKVAELAADKRVNVIDACMTAVPSMVRQGGLTFLVGGQKAFFDRAKPHLLKMAKDAVHMGPRRHLAVAIPGATERARVPGARNPPVVHPQVDVVTGAPAAEAGGIRRV